MQEKFTKININNFIIQYWQDKIEKIEKKDIDLIVSDFDDTIFSIEESLKENYTEGRRWEEWNKFLLENNLIDSIVKEQYKDKKYLKDISSKLRENHDLILTAWMLDFQVKKITALNLDNINTVVVHHAKDKIIELIEYIIFIDFIPNKITIYEDRPELFIEYKDLIENILWTKLEIFLVEMDWNREYKKIKKV